MLLQKARIGKTAVLITLLILFAVLAAMPLFLQADTTGETTPEAALFLPIIYNEDSLTPDPGAENTPTPTSSATPSPTNTATQTATSTPWCNLQFAQAAYGNSSLVLVTGDVGTEVIITNLSTNEQIGSGIMAGPIVGHDCPGYGYITVSPRLDETNVGDVLLAHQADNPENNDTTIVLDANNPQPTSTPSIPYIAVVPNCGAGPDVQFKIEGFNWPVDQTITLSWEGVPQIVLPANEHTSFFIMTWTFEGLSNGMYTLSALSSPTGLSASSQFYVSCELVPTSVPGPTNTPTPAPADLVVGQPVMVSTPPIIVYESVAFEVPITNTGDIAINTLFFVDLLFEPTSGHPTDVFTAVSGLAGNSTVTLTITSTIGFANFVGTHQVTGWVDSLDHVTEEDESNNLSVPLNVPIANFGGTPTSTPTPNGTEVISGFTRVFISGISLRQERMLVSVIDEATGLTVATTYSDEVGFYEFNNLPAGTYTVQGCITIDNKEQFGTRTGRTPPDQFADIFAFEQPCP